LVSSEGLDDQIKLFDSVDSKNLLDFFEESDFLFVSLQSTPLFSKTVPAKLQTYLAIGKPIIASISGEANQLLKEFQTGFQAEAGNSDQLSIIFDQLYKVNQKDHNLFSYNCKELYKHKFHSSKRKEQLFSIII